VASCWIFYTDSRNIFVDDVLLLLMMQILEVQFGSSVQQVSVHLDKELTSSVTITFLQSLLVYFMYLLIHCNRVLLILVVISCFFIGLLAVLRTLEVGAALLKTQPLHHLSCFVWTNNTYSNQQFVTSGRAFTCPSTCSFSILTIRFRCEFEAALQHKICRLQQKYHERSLVFVL
jgi:hypothetical protein